MLFHNKDVISWHYAEQVITQNNIDIEADNTPSISSPLTYDFAMPSLQTLHAPYERASNSSPTDNINMSLEPFPPIVIPYSANVLADPNLWNSNFTATSLMSSCKVTYAIWHTHYNIWYISLNSIV